MEKCWVEEIYLLMFAARELVQDYLGFSPFKFIVGYTVRGLLKLLKEIFL